MKTKLHLLAIFYRSFGLYLWAIPMIAWFTLGRLTGVALYAIIPALVLFKLFLQGITIHIFRRRYSHLFFFYANANLSKRHLFGSAFIADFITFFLSMTLIQCLSGWIK